MTTRLDEDTPSAAKFKPYWTVRQDSLPDRGEYWHIWRRFYMELTFRLEAMENEERKIIYFDSNSLEFRKRRMG